ncbi:MAG: hypothetical protein AB8B51_11475 [Sedimentitalea sp.]
MITQDHLQGHWQRDWIKAPGFEDHTTRVHWLQAGALFADLRVPRDRPDIAGHSCLADLGPPALRRLMESEGFAGHITVEDSKCTWHRQINWHGEHGAADIGLMSFDEAGGLIEDGVLAKYQELWQAVPQPALRGAQLRCGAMTGFLIENDAVFLLAIGGPPTGTRDDMIAALDNGTAEANALKAHFASAYVLGTWDNAHGIGTLASNPFYEGQVVLDRADSLVWHSIAFDGARAAHPLTIG